MKRFVCHILTFVLTLACTSLYAKDVTPLQIFFLVKQAFPQATEVSVLLTQDDYNTHETALKRATAQMKIKAKVHIVSGSQDVGLALQKVPEKSPVVVFDAPTLSNSSTKLYVLSKCKEKQIPLITTSEAYLASGALLGIFRDESDKVKITLNLQQNEHLKDTFTQDVIDKIGVKEVL